MEMGSNKAAELSDKEQNRRNKMTMKKKQQQVTEKDEQQNEVEERRNTPTVMKKKRRRAEEKYDVKSTSEDDTHEAKTGRKRDKSSRKKKRRNEDKSVGESGQLGDDVEDGSQEENGVGAAEQNQSETEGNTASSKDADKLEKSGENRKSLIASKKGKKSSEKRKGPQTDISFVKDEEVEADDVYHISSGDDDCSKGMKEWLVEYQQSRPRLKVLQEKIDEFITAHEAQLEQERKEREARVAEGGWTVVVHHKGRKKTTDSESGIAVGSVAQAAVEDKMTKKKNKEVGLDFYRFQKREAQRNEIMMLQGKFEQDKKRIQQLRAARKFRPY